MKNRKRKGSLAPKKKREESNRRTLIGIMSKWEVDNKILPTIKWKIKIPIVHFNYLAMLNKIKNKISIFHKIDIYLSKLHTPNQIKSYQGKINHYWTVTRIVYSIIIVSKQQRQTNQNKSIDWILLVNRINHQISWDFLSKPTFLINQTCHQHFNLLFPFFMEVQTILKITKLMKIHSKDPQISAYLTNLKLATYSITRKTQTSSKRLSNRLSTYFQNSQAHLKLVYSQKKLTSLNPNRSLKPSRLLRPLPSRLASPLSRLLPIKICYKAPKPQVFSVPINNVRTYSPNLKPLPQYSHQHLIHRQICLRTNLVIWIICLSTATMRIRISKDRKFPLNPNSRMSILRIIMYSLRRMLTCLRYFN